MTFINGLKVSGNEIWSKVPILMKGMNVVHDCVPLMLGGVMVILGMQWLQTSGQVHGQFSVYLIKFLLKQEIHTLNYLDYIFVVLVVTH